MIKQITIIGPGLLGASLAMAVHNKKIAKKIVLWGRNQNKLEHCSDHDWCHEVFTDLQLAVKDAELIVICTPVNHIISTLEKLSELAPRSAWITDVGSTKSKICGFANTLTIANQFIGSHPMAGSDKSGHNNALAHLYENQSCIITPSSDNDPKGTQFIEDFWKELGMKTGIMDPDEHDQMVASISHLPHLLSSSLSYNLNESGVSEWLKFSGNGLKDTTRISGGDPTMWCDIVEQNTGPILNKISSLQKDLEKLQMMIENNSRDEIFAFLQTGQNFRKQIEEIEEDHSH